MSRKLKEKTDRLLSKEKGTVYKDPGGKISVALVYPNTYHVGMSNLGFQGIYGLLNSRTDIVCERAFLPDELDMDEYMRTRTELFSLETKKPLNRFDIVAFSVSFENDYPNIARILNLSKIPRHYRERNVKHPLLIMGGACAFFNPEPVAEMFDICFIGDAEETLLDFFHIFGTSDRNILLKNSSEIEGIYVPRFYTVHYDSSQHITRREAFHGAPRTVKRRHIRTLSQRGVTSSIITSETEFSHMHLIEAMRGCPWNCRFCITSRMYAPLRKKPLDVIRNEIRDAKSKTAKIGLVGPSLSDYPEIYKILKIPDVDFSITSLRAGKKSSGLIGFLRDHRSVSIAPEAGTERLRHVIQKRITEDDILETSESIFSQGINTLRLYFMVGLPTETEEDIEGIVHLVRKIRHTAGRGNITLSVSTFVPKPFTPFQWHTMEAPSVVKKRLKMIKKDLSSVHGIRVFHDIPKYAYMQGLFSLGDRRVRRVLENMLSTEDWQKAALKAGIKKDFYLFRHKAFQEALPWDFIDMNIKKETLWEEYQEAVNPS
jgi:radical SAM superfamily enzyme YgiQ (UPF0313 family)